MKGCFIKKSPLPSFEDYGYTKDISLDKWKRNIKTTFKYTKLPWLSKYDGLMEDVYKCYNSVPFHNHTHAYDVFQMGICLLTRNKTSLIGITKLEKFTFCLALLCHDLDHRGFTNDDIAKDSSIHGYVEENDEANAEAYDPNSRVRTTNIDEDTELRERRSSYQSVSSICSSSSYNEKHHILCAIKLFEKHKIKYDELLFMKLISYTDLIKHSSFINKSEFIEFIEVVDQKLRNEHIMILFIKLADVGHILRPWYIHLDFVTAMNNERHVPLDCKELPKDTLWFNSMFVLPLIEKIEKVNLGFHYELMYYYNKNINHWSNLYKLINDKNKKIPLHLTI